MDWSQLLLNAERLRRFYVALFLALVVTIAVPYVTDIERNSSILRGDFPAFWSMAVIADSDTPEKLYDLSEQRSVQNAAWPSLEGSMLPAAYPPFLAYLLQPLVMLGPHVARLLWTILSCVLFYQAVSRLTTLNRDVATCKGAVLVAMALFGPVLVGVLGGQFTPVSMWLYATCLALERKRGRWADLLFGVGIGLWLLKPYFALSLLVVLIAQKRWRSLLGCALVAACWWLMGAQVLGVDWLSEWLAVVKWFSVNNVRDNAGQMPNVVAGLVWMARLLSFEGSIEAILPTLQLGGVLCSWIVIGYLARLDLRRDRSAISHSVILAVPATVILVPQTNFYELSLIACSCVVCFRKARLRDQVMIAICSLFGMWASLVRSGDGFPYFFVLSVIMVIYLVVSLRTIEQESQVDPTLSCDMPTKA